MLLLSKLFRNTKFKQSYLLSNYQNLPLFSLPSMTMGMCLTNERTVLLVLTNQRPSYLTTSSLSSALPYLPWPRLARLSLRPNPFPETNQKSEKQSHIHNVLRISAGRHNQLQSRTRIVVDRDKPVNSVLDWVLFPRVTKWTGHYHSLKVSLIRFSLNMESWVVAHKILVTAQRPNSPSFLFFGLGL